MDFKDKNNIGKEYNGFVVLDVQDIPDYKSVGVYLRHKKTGLEIYHLINDDNENLFAFAFRTLSKDSKGCAHIMEHSTLCGSEKFPLKEPFTTLENNSVKTFLNALTYPDRTAYPAASVVKSDYFNLMNVYADAVFFPLISKDTFIQEGWRLENDGENYSIQGVVYNEMKGNYSSFNSVACDFLFSSNFPDSVFAYDSGGDPLQIPNLTYQDFLAFHKKFYNPKNCLLFLYGNISTQEQLDFLSENFMSRIEQKYGYTNQLANFDCKLPLIEAEIKALQKINKYSSTQEINYIAPTTGSNGNMVCMNWYGGTENQTEKDFLSELLCGSDSSPLVKKLKNTKLGTDLSPLHGHFSDFHESIFSFGLTGVKEGKEQKTYDAIQKCIRQIYKEGFSQKDIDATIMDGDFSLREVTRYSGPFSLVIMDYVLNSWSYGDSPSKNLFHIRDFENFKSELKKNPLLPQQLLKKYLIDNIPTVKLTVRPSEKFFEERNKKELELIEKLKAQTDTKQLKYDLEHLHKYQQHKETLEELKCIPHVAITELSEKDRKRIPTEFTTVTVNDGAKIPVIINNQPTNGIFYLDVLFPLDALDPSFYEKLSFFNAVLCNLGWNGKDWSSCITESNCVLGDIWTRIICGSVPDCEDSIENAKKYSEYALADRNWLSFCCKGLTSQINNALTLMSEIITKQDFKDVKHFSILLKEFKTAKKSSIISNGLNYAIIRALSSVSKDSAMTEIRNGLSQLFTVESFTNIKIRKLLKEFEIAYKTIISSGGVIHITADEESLNIIKPLLKDFAQAANLTRLTKERKLSLENLLPYIKDLDLNAQPINRQVVKLSSQIGYVSCVSESSPYLTKAGISEAVFAKYLSLHGLWDKLRTTGGAYGAGCYTDNAERAFIMYTYRDPTPQKSFDTYLECLEEVCNMDITQEEVDCAIIATYSDFILPKSPSSFGNIGMERLLYGISDEIKDKQMQLLLSINVQDVKLAAQRILNNAKNKRNEVIICDKSINSCGNIINLPV